MSTREHAWNDPWSFDVDALLAATRVYPVDGPLPGTSDSVYGMPPFSSIKMCDGQIMHVWVAGYDWSTAGVGSIDQARYVRIGYAPDEDTYCDDHNSVVLDRTLIDVDDTYKNNVIASVSRAGDALVMVVTSDCQSPVLDASMGVWHGPGVQTYTSWDEGDTWVNPLDGISTYHVANPAVESFFYYDSATYGDGDDTWKSYNWWLANIYPYYNTNREDDIFDDDDGHGAGRNMPRRHIAVEPTSANAWAFSAEGNNGHAFRRRNGEYWVTFVDLMPDSTFPTDYNYVVPSLGRLGSVPSPLTQEQMCESVAEYERVQASSYFWITERVPAREQVFNETSVRNRYDPYDAWPAEYAEYPGYVTGDIVTVTDADLGGADTATTRDAWPGMMLVEDNGVLYSTIGQPNAGDNGRIYALWHTPEALVQGGVEWFESISDLTPTYLCLTSGAQTGLDNGVRTKGLLWVDDTDDTGSTTTSEITWFLRELSDGSVKHWWIRSGNSAGANVTRGGSWSGPCVGGDELLDVTGFDQDAVPATGDVHRIHSVLFRGEDRVWAPFSTAASNAIIALQATPKVTPPCRYPKRLLHVPYPKWQRENDGDGNLDHLWTNWLVWDRWVHQMVKDTERPGDVTCGVVTPPTMDKTCRIPYYRAANVAEHEQNWLAVERWSRQFCWAPHLHLPHKKPVSVHHDEENWAALMRWVQTVVETGKTRHPGCPGLGL